MAPLRRHPGEPGPRGDGARWEAALETSSPAMHGLGRLLAHAARNEVNVLLLGESGTGKTTLAPAIHEMSARAARPFVRVACLAAPGDFSGPARAARRGTLFLDEVGELSPAGQTCALRLLQDTCPLPFRLVASTSRDPRAEMGAGRLRRDLFYRLDVLEIRIPSLRERVEDILPIARAFLTSRARAEGRPPPELSPGLEEALLRYSWPGNIQELLGVLERMLILSTGLVLDVAALPERILAAADAGTAPGMERG